MKIILSAEGGSVPGGTDDKKYVLRFNKGEELIEGLINFCEAEKIEAGWFFAIGATAEITISYYNLREKKYHDTEIKEGMEIISLSGNVAVLNNDNNDDDGRKNKIIIHAHGNFAGSDLKPIAGHVKKLVVGPTCEVVLEKLKGKIEREYSDEIGLNLLK